MYIVRLRKQKYEEFERRMRVEKELDCNNYGVPRQHGLFYAMGLALAMEGVMSACYHVCPTNVTFQFDTTFMYLISLLMFMKLYQVRHADVSPDAVVVFLGLGVALILEIISIYHTGPAFWVLFSLVR